MADLRNEAVLATLRKQLQEAKDDLRKYKQLYQNELAENRVAEQKHSTNATT